MGEHIRDMVRFLFAVRVGIVNAIVNDPKAVECRIDINAGHDPDTFDDLTRISTPLTTHRLDVERMTLIQDRVVKEQVTVLVWD
jgi:hypothetical protein